MKKVILQTIINYIVIAEDHKDARDITDDIFNSYIPGLLDVKVLDKQVLETTDIKEVQKIDN